MKSTSKFSDNQLAVERRPIIGDLMPYKDFSPHQSHCKRPGSSGPLQGHEECQEIAISEILWISQEQKESVLQKDFNALKSQLG